MGGPLEETKVEVNKKEYIIDSVLEGCHDFEKLKNIYSDLKKDVIKEDPIQCVDEALITIQKPNWRGISYLWELYSLEENGSIMIEAFGGTEGYSNPFMFPKKIG